LEKLKKMVLWYYGGLYFAIYCYVSGAFLRFFGACLAFFALFLRVPLRPNFFYREMSGFDWFLVMV